MFSRLCVTDGEVYSLLREGKKITVGESPKVFLRHLLGVRLGVSPDDWQDILHALHNNPKRFDLAKVLQLESEVRIAGFSEQFGFPRREDLPLLRAITVEVLQKQYPDLKIVQRDF